MRFRRLTVVAATVTCAVLVAAPVLAANSTPGSKGEAGASRAAPATIPGTAKPLPVPSADPANASRGIFGADEAAALASMGTVTLNSDGSVDEQPASASLRSLVSDEVKGKDNSGTTPRYVPPPDTRTQITDASAYPDDTVGWLWVQDQKGGWATCTATLIGPQSVITAAHCVYDHETGGWVKSITFYPGITDGKTAPEGSYDYQSAHILKGFIDNYDGKNYDSVMPWDLAEITLKSDAGNQIGWMGFEVDDSSPWHATIVGYPGDKPDGTMWQSECDIPANPTPISNFSHVCATYAGSSGSSMWQDAGGGDLYIRGINVAENLGMKLNFGTRLIDSYYQFLLDNYK
ncbi:MAG TPA: trypsin-like serine protease [Devosia sp.]|nr:trypsin-like serine protease [Devosia sp.]